MNPSSIDIIGADANNLKSVDVRFPLKKISVVTGVSGSGKSSLLADTVAAEGSRRMRTFLGTSQQELEREDVLAFIGPLPPTILVGQRGFRPSIRTTTGTATGFLSVLRRLFVLYSTPYSERVKDTVPQPSPDSYARWIANHYRGPIEVWAAPVRQQRTDGVSAVNRLSSHGIEEVIVRSETDPPRLRETGRRVPVSQFRGLNPNVLHTIEAFVGKVQVKSPADAGRLRELLNRAFPAAKGPVVVTLSRATDPDLSGPFGPRLDSTKHWVHPDAPEIFAHPTVHLLSFNSPGHEESGACRACNGTGTGRRLREEVLVQHPERSMRDGAFAIWTEKNYKYVNIQHETIEGLRGMRGFSPDVPWSKLPPGARALVLDGAGEELVADRDRAGRSFGSPRPFVGFRKIILEKSSGGTKIADQLAAYVEAGPCDACGGTRWSFQARALRIGVHSISKILGMNFAEVETFTSSRNWLPRPVTPDMLSLAEAIHRHAHSIVSVGLGYLTGDRGMLDVSEGESRRIRLARVLDAGEKGLCLLFDEPARGLHESEITRLSHSFERLRGEHTIILNEHRERLWDVADWFIEVGPGAGASGGEVTYAGRRKKHEDRANEPQRTPLAVNPNQPKISVKGASIHNVQNLDCEIPIGRLTCISGVSGSGKSSFVRGILAPALLASVGGAASDFSLRQGRWRSVSGTGSISEVVALDQVVPPPNRRSLVATLIGVFDSIRKVLGASSDAKREGLTASDFGVNAGIGRCPVCAGVGEVGNEDIWSVCPTCGGSRYGQAALSVRIDGINIQELLETPFERLAGFAGTFGIPQRLIASICDLGIGYIALGRRVDTLSGGEIQRLRLAIRLSVESPGSILFILDEPAVGLHPRDVGPLVTALDRLLHNGRNTVVIVEHNLRLIRSADWILDFGPGSGPAGGRIIFAGPPERLAKTKTPTGLALAGKLPAQRRLPEPAKKTFAGQKVPPKVQLERTSALMRTLISGDGPAVLESEGGLAEPSVVITERFWTEHSSWEVAGLDREIPKLLLDVQQGAKAGTSAELLHHWADERDCWLAIQPFLTDMQVWGASLPVSVVRTISSHLAKEGLRLVTTKGDPVHDNFDARHVRATGGRLVPEGNSTEGRCRALQDAIAIGAGYVELRERGGRLRAVASNRLLDLESAVIAPMMPVPSHFSRLDPRGRCPMCKGKRTVTAISEKLVIGNRHAPPDSERFLTAEAHAVMKGIVRNELNPFLRRLAREELWDPKSSFERLQRSKRDLIMFGFWSRSGPGSFLKSSSANPLEVASWLRWDGLYRHVLEQADRSRDTGWAQEIRRGAYAVRCLLCEGSGLQQFASLLKVGEVSFPEWTVLSSSARMLDLLRAVAPHSPRQRRTKERILDCLAPLQRPDSSLVSAAVVKEAVKSFTTMPAVELGLDDEG
jgi:excinuclease ABC A subunit